MHPITFKHQKLPKIKRDIRPLAPELTTNNFLAMKFNLHYERQATNYQKMFAQRSAQLNPMLLITATILLTLAPQVFSISSTIDQQAHNNGADTAIGLAQNPPTVSMAVLDAPELLQQTALSSEPRQYFKIHITPGAKQRNSKRAAVHKQVNVRRSSAGSTDQASQHPETGKQKQVSNAALKKLLNQSLIKASNGSLVSPKASNFKFMFIQRASPNKSNNNKDTSRQKDPSSSTASNKAVAGSSPSPLDHPAASLAASVSKHLATSLLSSASDIVANLSSMPSLTSLATQIVAHSLENQRNGEKQANSTSPASSSQEQNLTSDIKKITSAISEKRKNENKPKQPSKVYNLPVKFVSNGQPNLVVFHAIRKHFATIKKLQAERQKFSSSMRDQGNNNNSNNSNNNNKKTKNRPQNQVHKLKGNSRFIYLPLKYLSNAKPNKVLVGKTVAN